MMFDIPLLHDLGFLATERIITVLAIFNPALARRHLGEHPTHLSNIPLSIPVSMIEAQDKFRSDMRIIR